jgi:amino acid adenylation domain-containing protein
MTGLHHLIEARAFHSPSAVAVVFNGAQLTYRQLNARADLLAAQLHALGVRPNTLVGLCMQRSLELVIGLLGILKAGGAYVPIDPTYPRERIEFMLEDSGLLALVTERSLVAELPPSKARTVLLDEPGAGGLPAPPRDHFSPENLAYVIYTSGSTGQPKGVQIEHRAVVNFLDSMRRTPGLQADDAVLALTTLSFDIAVLEIFLPLSVGARVVIGTWETSVDGEAIMAELNRHGITLLQATPTTWRLLLASGWRGSAELKALCGGEPMPVDLARELIPRCAELWNMYGPTETTVWSTCARIRRPDQITVGRPIAHTDTLILTPDLQAVATGEPGELFIGGKGLARGYHQRPSLTGEKFLPHPFKPGERVYRTGDLARFNPAGEIDCLGRLDLQIKIRGHRIELGEIETTLTGYPGVEHAVVSACDDAGGDKRLVAYFTAARESQIVLAELREHARKRLPDYMLPAAFVRLEKIPLTPNGKVDRKSLPAPGEQDVVTDGRGHPPATPAEERLAAIWRKVLGLSSIGRHDKFFDLGGTSLLAVKVFAEIEKQFGRHLPLASLFNAPTIADLVKTIEQADPGAPSWSSLVAIQPAGTKPRFFCVHGAGGNVILYFALAQRLGPDFPFYGLHSQGLDGKTAPLQTVEEMAAHYIGEIQRVQPHGPYCLGGYCLGGTIALEMARQLTAQGEKVALVALFDTYNFRRTVATSHLHDLAQRLWFHVGNFARLSPVLMRNYLREKVRVARDGELANVLRARAKRPQKEDGTIGRSALRTIQETNDQAAEYYQPKPYSGGVTLFSPRVNYAKFPDPHMGWDGIVLGRIEVVSLPMNPHAMLVEPTVKHLATALAASINRTMRDSDSNFPFPRGKNS